MTADRKFELRKARLEDSVEIESLIARSSRGLGVAEYSAEQIELALLDVLGLDSTLIIDGTYYVVQLKTNVVACGGWSYRQTMFGGDRYRNREDVEIEPGEGAARIRAFFVEPAYSRNGLATMILEQCEKYAVRMGFRRFELMSTLSGVRFYRSRGFMEREPVEYALQDGSTIEFVPMFKDSD